MATEPTPEDIQRISACLYFCRHLPTGFMELHYASKGMTDMQASLAAMRPEGMPDGFEDLKGFIPVSSTHYDD
jgi:hypothetical protein